MEESHGKLERVTKETGRKTRYQAREPTGTLTERCTQAAGRKVFMRAKVLRRSLMDRLTKELSREGRNTDRGFSCRKMGPSTTALGRTTCSMATACRRGRTGVATRASGRKDRCTGAESARGRQDACTRVGTRTD